MKTVQTAPTPIGDDLKTSVENLLRRLPNGARPILVVVCDPRFVGIKQASVRGVRVEFVAPEQVDNLGSGDFVLTYAYDDMVVDEVTGGHDGIEIAKPFDGSDVVAFLQDLRRK